LVSIETFLLERSIDTCSQIYHFDIGGVLDKIIWFVDNILQKFKNKEAWIHISNAYHTLLRGIGKDLIN
jgi:hypothetical protein